MRLITKELTNFKIPLRYLSDFLSNCQPRYWSLPPLFILVVLAPQASGRGLGEATRPPTASSPPLQSRRSLFCRAFTFLPLPTRLLQLQPPGGLVDGKTLF